MLTLVRKRFQARCKLPVSVTPGGEIQSTTDPRLRIEETLEPADLQGAVGRPPAIEFSDSKEGRSSLQH